jgi:hypothetical protein
MMLIGAIAVLNKPCEQIDQIADRAAGGRRHSPIAGEEETGAFPAAARC